MLRIKRDNVKAACAISVSAMSLCIAGLAQAQEAPPAAEAQGLQDDADAGGGEIIVTARRRDESLRDVPVAVAAVTGEQLATRGVVTLEGFARLVPQLFIANSSGSFQGGAVGLRGITAGDGNVFGDQAVAFNIDGVLIARSTPRSLAAFDMESIQVYKGPQALFYGKNSPGGIISLRTADPTDRLEVGATASYEFEGHEARGEGFISGPLTDAIGARVAISASTLRGWVRTTATSNATYGPTGRYAPSSDEINGRVTLKYDNGGPFTARFKAAYGSITGDSIFANNQIIYCPTGTARLAPNDDCLANNAVTEATLGTRFGSGGANTVTGAAIPGVYVFGNGQPFSKVRQFLTGLEMGYELTDTLTLSSTTGYYDAASMSLGNPAASDPALGGTPEARVLASYGAIYIKELSQELRLTSDFDGMFNFMLGGAIQDQKLRHVAAGAFGAVNPVQIFQPLTLRQSNTPYSVFANVMVKPADQIELSGGARYSREKKNISFYRLLAGALPASQGGAPYVAGQFVPTAVPERTFDNLSPEFTAKWKPMPELTAYVSWKRGFLSGGFNATGPGSDVALIPDRSYGDETVEGFEGGVKFQSDDRKLSLNLAAYSYRIKGLQVTAALTSGTTVRTIVSNAASAKSQGIEADFVFAPAEGLNFHGGISYSHARYVDFTQSPCYSGQSISLGCNLTLIGSAYVNQDLSGAQLLRAPDWAGSIGANYDLELGSGNKVGFSVDGNYTSKFFTDAVNTPAGIQKAYWMLDASVRYEMANGVTFALIGRNLADKIVYQRSTAVPFTAGASGTAVAALAEQSGSVQRGREIRLQASYRF